MSDPLSLSKKQRKVLIERMRETKIQERELVSPFMPSPLPPLIPQVTKYLCPKCKMEVEQLTRDHIIPKWLYNPSRLKDLGLRTENEKWSKISSSNKRLICFPCNAKKGGGFDYTDPIVRQFVKNLIKRFQANLDAHPDIPIRINVVCKCNEVE